jgi:hypothetical protein
MSFRLLRCKALGFGQCNIEKSGELKWLVSTLSLKTGKNNAGPTGQPIEKADARHKRDLFGRDSKSYDRVGIRDIPVADRDHSIATITALAPQDMEQSTR